MRSLGPEETLTDELIDRCGPICAQMGAEPIIRALDEGAEVILAGRACDDAIFAAMPMLKGMDAGLAFHMGKILECAGISAVPCDLAEPDDRADQQRRFHRAARQCGFAMHDGFGRGAFALRAWRSLPAARAGWHE